MPASSGTTTAAADPDSTASSGGALLEANPPNEKHFYVQAKQMNATRRAQIEAKYPNILNDLEESAGTGSRMWTAYFVWLIVALQIAMAALMHFQGLSAWVIVPTAWLVKQL